MAIEFKARGFYYSNSLGYCSPFCLCFLAQVAHALPGASGRELGAVMDEQVGLANITQNRP